MKAFLSCIVVLFFAACLESEHSKKPLIHDFIKSEIERLSKEKPTVIKIATLNGKSDTIITDSLDWKRELNVFLMNDLDSMQLLKHTPTTVEIVIQKKHDLFTYYKKLIYNSEKGYEISGSQDIKFIDGIDYKVAVNFK